jgi:predicted ATPase
LLIAALTKHFLESIDLHGGVDLDGSKVDLGAGELELSTLLFSAASSVETQFSALHVIGKLTQYALRALGNNPNLLYTIFPPDHLLFQFLPLLLALPEVVLSADLKPSEVTNCMSAENKFSKLSLILKHIFDRLTQRHRILIVAEDVQWIDTLSVRLLSSMTLSLSSKVMFLFTSRIGSPFVKDLLQTPNVCYIKLEILHIESISLIIENLVEAKPHQQLVRLVFDKCNGVPLFGKLLSLILFEIFYIDFIYHHSFSTFTSILFVVL